MPIYTYRCEECGEKQPQKRSVAERDALAICFDCGGEAKRIFDPTAHLIIPAAFQLPMDWAGTGGEGQSLTGRSQIRKPRTESLREAFDAVKDWG